MIVTKQELENFRYSTIFRKCDNCDKISYLGIYTYKKSRNDEAIIICKDCYRKLMEE